MTMIINGICSLSMCIGMNTDEKIGIMLKGTVYPFIEIHIYILGTGHDSLCPSIFKHALEKLTDLQHYIFFMNIPGTCLLYTSDAADEEDSVDLGGRRIIK